MRRCYVCDTTDESLFSPSARTLCAGCNREYQKQWYQNNKTKHKKHTAQRKRNVLSIVRENLIAYFSEHPCVDCGESDIRVLDFDHKGDKRTEVSSLMRYGYGWDVVFEEIKKCVVRCANCHRKRTASQFNWWRVKISSKH
jgi:hypothetical protein